jgi:hypothetical protein
LTKQQITVEFNTVMEDPVEINELKDRGGRRVLPDRRKRSSSEHFPERRSHRHRRSGTDRRSLQNQNMRKRKERRRGFRDKYSGSDSE